MLKHDDKNGGLPRHPKFPSSMKIDFLLAIQESQSVRKNPVSKKPSVEAANHPREDGFGSTL